MSDRDGYDMAFESVCNILREYRLDYAEGIENDDLVFEADYADKILNSPTVLADFRERVTQPIATTIRRRLDGHNYDEPWDKGYKVGLRDALEDIASAQTVAGGGGDE